MQRKRIKLLPNSRERIQCSTDSNVVDVVVRIGIKMKHPECMQRAKFEIRMAKLLNES